MNEQHMEPVEAACQRARLHVRAGRRRLRQGKLAAGICTIYDALVSAMRWYVLAHPQELAVSPRREDLEDDDYLVDLLTRAGVLDDSFNFKRLEGMVEKAINRNSLDLDWQKELTEIESVLNRLGLLPFDERTLPPEDPATF